MIYNQCGLNTAPLNAGCNGWRLANAQAELSISVLATAVVWRELVALPKAKVARGVLAAELSLLVVKRKPKCRVLILESFSKQPDEVLDYDFDFTQWLAQQQVDVSDYETRVLDQHSPDADVALLVSGSYQNNGTVKLFLSSGVIGKRYVVTVALLTVGGLRKEASILVKIKGDACGTEIRK